ncbi:MAG: PQQ-dependent sugar dehydrogenase [Spirochaetia bacterium]
MFFLRKRSLLLFIIFCSLFSRLWANTNLPLQSLTLLPGYQIEVYAAVPMARAMTMIKGHLFVSTKNGSIFHVSPQKKTKTIISGLGLSFGITHQGNDLYFTNRDQVFVVKNILSKITNGELIEKEVFVRNLPDHGERYHTGKYIRIFGEEMFISIGRPGDVTESPGDQFGKIIRIDMKTKRQENYAVGLRNSVGFDLHPVTKRLWFSDNGPDRMGDNLPAEEINEVKYPGDFFGFPYTHGGTRISENPRVAKAIDPTLFLPAHVAPLGISFYRGSMFPQLHNKALLIAEHGSWASKTPVGYQISMFSFEDNGLPTLGKKYEIFATGWMNHKTGKAWGRPVDIIQDAAGSIFISDDHAGVIYRIFR